MRGGKRVFLSAPPHPSPLPEGEEIFSSGLLRVKICAEQYWVKSKEGEEALPA